MRNLKKIVKKKLLIFLILIPVASFAHFFPFPEQTRSILVDYSNFKKEDRFYFSPSTAQRKIDSVQSLIQLASNRVAILGRKDL